MGLKDRALKWVKSYLTDRKSRVLYGRKLSSHCNVKCGVPQGSILGLLLFVMFLSELEIVVGSHPLKAHFYADDIQLYKSHDPENKIETIRELTDCIRNIEEWLRKNRLKLNPAKTELICLGRKTQVAKAEGIIIDIDGVQIQCSSSVRNLGAILDENLTMSQLDLCADGLRVGGGV